MRLAKPGKTLADYLVIGVSPVLIMLLVGSLVFFLIQVFYRGELQDSVRWVMFWFVLAVVLVARIGIEQGKAYASFYGVALALATWLYLARTHPAYLLGMVLLALVWWSANKLTWDCTLIDDDQDASGHGLLAVALRQENVAEPQTPRDPPPSAGRTGRTVPLTGKREPAGAPPHAPGLWVVYFSLAALPLFGLGHVLLPSDESDARRLGFTFLLVYLVAALGLLLTTSFLGLRRYLRQRYLAMPPIIALGWIKSGAGVALVVLALALLVPRPGADYTWKTLAYQIDYNLQRASEYASRRSPPGEGEGRAGSVTHEGEDQNAGGPDGNASSGRSRADGKRSRRARPDGGIGGAESEPLVQATAQSPRLYDLLKTLLLVAGALWMAWWLFRRRHSILEALRAFWQAVIQFFKDLLGIRLFSQTPRPTGLRDKPAPRGHPFAAYRNPFVSGKDRVWSPEQLVAYSFDAVQAWTKERKTELRPDRTPREFCMDLGAKFPELSAGLESLAYLYSHAAYRRRLPADPDWGPIRELWRYLCEASR